MAQLIYTKYILLSKLKYNSNIEIVQALLLQIYNNKS